jgi:hypothetical protein
MSVQFFSRNDVTGRIGNPLIAKISQTSQGRPQLRLQKSDLPKANPKLASCTCLSWSRQSFSFCSVDEEVPCFQSLQSRRFEARRGLATPRTQNVLAQGQSEAYGDSKLNNTIVEDAWKSTCERNLRECFRCVQFYSVMSQFASFFNGNLLMHSQNLSVQS